MILKTGASTAGLYLVAAFIVVAFSLRSMCSAAQPAESLDLTALGRDTRWKIAGRTASVVDIGGKHALKLSEGPGMGVVWLGGYDFTDGVIEIDMLGRSQPVQGSFVGVAFRIIDEQTHDAVYFRPFNFRSTDPVSRSHAVQYISNPGSPWQILRSAHPGEYERAVVPEPDGDQWFHVRIVVERPSVKAFVNEISAPVLAVRELSDRAHGSVGVWVGEGSGGYFANLRVTPTL